jgi:arginine utilization protein RocB
MIVTVSHVHRQRLEEIRKSVQELGYKESQFVKVELLFFEALSIAKTYGEDPEQNSLLAALKDLQYDQYEKTKVATRKATERESAIRRFIVALRKALSETH